MALRKFTWFSTVLSSLGTEGRSTVFTVVWKLCGMFHFAISMAGMNWKMNGYLNRRGDTAVVPEILRTKVIGKLIFVLKRNFTDDKFSLL